MEQQNNEQNNQQEAYTAINNVSLEDDSPQEAQEAPKKSSQASNDLEKITQTEAEEIANDYIRFIDDYTQEKNIKVNKTFLGFYKSSTAAVLEKFVPRSLAKKLGLGGFIALSAIILPPIVIDIIRGLLSKEEPGQHEHQG